MKLADLKIIHILLAISILAWVFLFFDWQKTKYQLGFTNWQGQVGQAIGQLDQRVKGLEGRNIGQLQPQSQPKK